MSTSSAFAGFHEAPIAFPPTFKYDVMHTYKGHRNKKSFGSPPNGRSSSALGTREEESDTEDDEDGVKSVQSSTWASTASKREDDSDDERSPAVSSRRLDAHRGRTSPLTINLVTVVHKAKAKFQEIVSPSAYRHGGLEEVPPFPFLDLGIHSKAVPQVMATSIDPGIDPRASTSNTDVLEIDQEDDRQGVYDSSHKQRVPSW